MVVRQAVGVRMIGQGFNDSTLLNTATIAILDHAFKFAFKSCEPRDPLIDVIEVTACNLGSSCA